MADMEEDNPDSQGTELQGMYVNLDGWTAVKQSELRDIATKETSLGFIICSEVNRSQNEYAYQDTSIQDFTSHYFPRESGG